MQYIEILIYGLSLGLAFLFFSIPAGIGLAIMRQFWKRSGK